MGRTLFEIMRDEGCFGESSLRKPVSREGLTSANRMTMAEFRAERAREAQEYHDRMAEGAVDADAARAGALRRAMVAAGVPERFSTVAADQRPLERLAGGSGIWFAGPAGTGKTTRACSVLKGWLSSGRGGRFVDAVALTDAVSGLSGSDAADALGTAPLLVIDDLGKGTGTTRAVDHLWQVVNARWGRRLPTVVTSQWLPSEAAERMAGHSDVMTAQSIVSRLMDGAGVVRTDGPDMRIAGGAR